MSRRQHHKGRKRPRSWHRGTRAGRHQARALRRIEQVFAKAAR